MKTDNWFTSNIVIGPQPNNGLRDYYNDDTHNGDHLLIVKFYKFCMLGIIY